MQRHPFRVVCFAVLALSLAACGSASSGSGESVPPGGGKGIYKVGTALSDRRHLVLSCRGLELRRDRYRLVVWRAVPRQIHCEWRGLRSQPSDRGASHAADADRRARHQSREWPLDRGARQRSRSLCARPYPRPVTSRRAAFGLRGARHGESARPDHGSGIDSSRKPRRPPRHRTGACCCIATAASRARAAGRRRAAAGAAGRLCRGQQAGAAAVRQPQPPPQPDQVDRRSAAAAKTCRSCR